MEMCVGFVNTRGSVDLGVHGWRWGLLELLPCSFQDNRVSLAIVPGALAKMRLMCDRLSVPIP